MCGTARATQIPSLALVEVAVAQLSCALEVHRRTSHLRNFRKPYKVSRGLRRRVVSLILHASRGAYLRLSAFLRTPEGECGWASPSRVSLRPSPLRYSLLAGS